MPPLRTRLAYTARTEGRRACRLATPASLITFFRPTQGPRRPTPRRPNPFRPTPPGVLERLRHARGAGLGSRGRCARGGAWPVARRPACTQAQDGQGQRGGPRCLPVRAAPGGVPPFHPLPGPWFGSGVSALEPAVAAVSCSVPVCFPIELCASWFCVCVAGVWVRCLACDVCRLCRSAGRGGWWGDGARPHPSPVPARAPPHSRCSRSRALFFHRAGLHTWAGISPHRATARAGLVGQRRALRPRPAVQTTPLPRVRRPRRRLLRAILACRRQRAGRRRPAAPSFRR